MRFIAWWGLILVLCCHSNASALGKMPGENTDSGTGMTVMTVLPDINKAEIEKNLKKTVGIL